MTLTSTLNGSSISIYGVDSIKICETETFKGLKHSFYKTLIVKSNDGSEVEINLLSKENKSLKTEK